MDRILFIVIVLLISACVSSKRVQTDYNIAEANDRRAKSSRERASFEEARNYEREADKLRKHDSSAVIVGAVVENMFGKGNKKSENGVWK